MKKIIYLLNIICLSFFMAAQFPVEAQSWSCGDSIIIDHEAGDVAPVTKTITYGTVTNIPGDTLKCWITSNLGADHQANAVDDPTEASAGWYWQFNRMQGYKHDGNTRTPNTDWITEIDEDLDWQAENDPCALELGSGWRIPTYTEWNNADAAGEWSDWNGPWNSALKIHAAGLLSNCLGSLAWRGQNGYYWSSTQSSSKRAWDLYFYHQICYMNIQDFKSYGLTIRCLRDEIQIDTPEICIVTVPPDDHNHVIWEKQPSVDIDSYNVYRETTQANVYEVIGSVDWEDPGIFVDLSSNPQQRAYKYKISAISDIGVETPLSNYHRTIHLTLNEGPTGWNLIWSLYEGFPFSTYYIYRGIYADSLTLFDSISSSFTSYTDINPPWGPLYYAIEVVNEEGCFIGREDGYSRSRSNVQFNGMEGISDNPESGISIYPNPAKDKLFVQFDREVLNAKAEVTILDIQGKAMISEEIEIKKSCLSLNDLKPGVYIIHIRFNETILTRKLIVY